MADKRWIWMDFRGGEDLLMSLFGDLQDLGAIGCEESDRENPPLLRVWWEASGDTGRLLGEARRAAGRLEVEFVASGIQEEEDWLAEWRKHRRPVEAGRRFLLCPPECVPESGVDRQVLIVDQRMAFGSGHHATTRLCIKMLEDAVAPGDRVVDVGAGTAILSVVAAKLGAGSVLAFEIDPDVREEAIAILAANDTLDRVDYRSEAFRDESLDAGRLVVANLILSRLLPLLAGLRRASCGSHLLVSGIETDQGTEARSSIAAEGFEIVGEHQLEGWLGFVCKSP